MSPTAAQLEDFHSILQAGAPAGDRKRIGFGAVEVGRATVPVAAAVLVLLAEDLQEEIRRDFVMLFIGLFREERYRTAVHVVYEVSFQSCAVLAVICVQIIQSLVEQTPNSMADNCVRYQSLFCPVNDLGCCVLHSDYPGDWFAAF